MCLFHICNLLSFNTLNDPICSLDLEFQFSKIFFYFSFTLSAFKYFKYMKCIYICRVGKGRVDEQYRGKCLLSNMNKQYCKMTVSILPSPALSLRFVSTWYSSLSRLNKTLSRSPSVDFTQTALSFSPGL